MKKIEIAPGISASKLGFGCASILGLVDDKTASRSLDFAMDKGVNYFDVAPSYGYGDAEAWLGRKLRDRRDSVVIATKYGISATPLARSMRVVKPVIRWLRRIQRKQINAPQMRLTGFGRVGNIFLRRDKMTPGGLEQSVNRSLKRLATDRIDILFLHEPTIDGEGFTDILEMAKELKEAGKIRACGLAIDQSQLRRFRDDFKKFDILQFNSPSTIGEYQWIREVRSSNPNVIHSPFRSMNFVRAPNERIRKAAGDFKKSIVLCSMFSENHICENVKNVIGDLA